MRFEAAKRNTASLVTTKGWSGRSHHPKRSEMPPTPVDFLCIDGEGMNINGEHRYVLIGIGDDQLVDENGLEWADIFGFLYRFNRPNTAFVGFFLGYDFAQTFKTFPEDTARELLTSEGREARKNRIVGRSPYPVTLDGWEFDVLAMKRLRIRPKRRKTWMYICDTGSFFQTSFLNVIDPKGWAPGTEIVSDEEFAIITAGKEKRSTAVLDREMQSYNRLENRVLARVLGTLDRGFHDIGIHLPPSKWFGPGQAAQAWLSNEGVPTSAELFGSSAEQTGSKIPLWFIEPARMSYFGGWFELFMHGIIPGVTHEYDINSAYPSIIAELPCLMHGSYSRGNGLPPDSDPGDLVLVYANLWAPNMPDGKRGQHIGTMLHRDSEGRILRPLATEGWYWWDELQAARRAGLVKRLDNRGKQQVQRWVRYVPCDCSPPMAGIRGLYQKRLDVGKTSPLGKAAKLVYNSGYGKFAQSVGDPIFGNPILASRITSGCRTQILDAIATHPKGKADVAMVATDAVYFLSEHPTLTVSESLGEWDHKERRNIALFKPGVYWDDDARRKIASGGSPHFKARGFRASDFVSSIARVDEEFRAWGSTGQTSTIDVADWPWPTVQFASSFSMTTALQALRQNDWSRAGRVTEGVPLTQNADPYDKRSGLYLDGGVWRSEPHFGMSQPGSELEWIASHPYEKRFGMEDPFSDEYKEQMGVIEDGNIADILAWILKGE